MPLCQKQKNVPNTTERRSIRQGVPRPPPWELCDSQWRWIQCYWTGKWKQYRSQTRQQISYRQSSVFSWCSHTPSSWCTSQCPTPSFSNGCEKCSCCINFSTARATPTPWCEDWQALINASPSHTPQSSIYLSSCSSHNHSSTKASMTCDTHFKQPSLVELVICLICNTRYDRSYSRDKIANSWIQRGLHTHTNSNGKFTD